MPLEVVKPRIGLKPSSPECSKYEAISFQFAIGDPHEQLHVTGQVRFHQRRA